MTARNQRRSEHFKVEGGQRERAPGIRLRARNPLTVGYDSRMSAEDKVQKLGLDLSAVGPPAGNYVPAVRTGNLVFISGQLPLRPDGSWPAGRVGEGVSIEEGYEAARLAGVALLARLRSELGSLDRVKRIVKVTGFVNATPDFAQHAQVINGASDLLAEVFGEAGKHARAAVGMGSLPLGSPVEVELIAEVSIDE
jgi:enamine deaminase RidA (YjgF/YER057c/UK114 family)